MIFGIIGNIAKTEIKDVLKNLISFFRKREIEFVIHEQLGIWFNKLENNSVFESSVLCKEGDLLNRANMLIVLGGDGTMLAAARLVGSSGVPILGVNLGKLGFLAEVPVEDLEECLNEILSNNYYIDERMILTSVSQSDNSVLSCLNDIVIDKGASARVIDIETYVNDEYLVTHAADGIIVSTPTGSTAYSLATGGPIVVPDSPVIMINPMAPHSLTARPVIVPNDSIIRIIIKTGSKPVHITADGQIEGFYNIPAEFTVQKGDYKIKLVRSKKRAYYDLLRAKLLWGRDVRIGIKK